jgi:hypothetical protein
MSFDDDSQMGRVLRKSSGFDVTSPIHRTIRHIVDQDGNRIALVPLGRQGRFGNAIIGESDLELLDSLGLSLRWNRLAKSGQVVAPCSRASGSCVQVARVLLDLGPGENVSYRNGDHTDLRRSNLAVNPEGYAIRRDRDYLTPKKRRRSSGPGIRHIYE